MYIQLLAAYGCLSRPRLLLALFELLERGVEPGLEAVVVDVKFAEAALHTVSFHLSFPAADTRAFSILDKAVLLGGQHFPDADEALLGDSLDVDEEVAALHDVALLLQLVLHEHTGGIRTHRVINDALR